MPILSSSSSATPRHLFIHHTVLLATPLLIKVLCHIELPGP